LRVLWRMQISRLVLLPYLRRYAIGGGPVLDISPRTVDHHVAAMLRTTGARSRTDLVGLCYAARVLVPGLWPAHGAFRWLKPAGIAKWKRARLACVGAR
jgi:hypothetical protein